MSSETVLCASLALWQPLELGSGENAFPCPLGTIWGWTVGDSSLGCRIAQEGQAGGTASAEAQPGAFWSPPREMERAPGLPWLSLVRTVGAWRMGRGSQLSLECPCHAPRPCPPAIPALGKCSWPGTSRSCRAQEQEPSPTGLPPLPAQPGLTGRPAGALP